MKRIISSLVCIALTVSASVLPVSADEAKTPSYQPMARQMEKLGRGLVAVDTGSAGVYLSWRLLGTESLENQAFDIYRDGEKIHTSEVDGATCWTDAAGKAASKYKVVPAGADASAEKEVTPIPSSQYTNYGDSTYPTNMTAYMDVPVQNPGPGTLSDGTKYNYTANDMSVGDLDGDGEYELIVKWDPDNSKDNSQSGITGNVIIDAYKTDGTQLWRLDLGPNIRAGAHYTQYMVYDFDGDGKAEIAFKTAPGSKDGKGNYVSAVGKNIEAGDNTKEYRNKSGYVLDGPEWLTIFNGETGEAMQTVNFDPPRTIKDGGSKPGQWGDNYGNRCERYLAGVAYLNGKTPSLIEVRGYYTFAYVTAYSWDGENLTEQWISKNEEKKSWVEDGKGNTLRESKAGYTLYGQGAHSLSVADLDNDGKDEIIFGSAFLDDDGTVLYSDGRGHGDAEHVSDFDNDGKQEVFMVHEAGKQENGPGLTIDYAIDIKRYDRSIMTQTATGDVGRGIMGNFVDDPSALALFWSSSNGGIFKQDGTQYAADRPDGNNRTRFINFGIYWDDKLDWELLDDTMLGKLTASGLNRYVWAKSNATYFPGASSNDSNKKTPGLCADIFGDWREEVIFRTDDNNLRIFMSCIPTQYRLTTLMHDSQYRCAIAWQNTGYNQPPHTSYYIGSASLATDESGATKNYLAPAVPFTKILVTVDPHLTIDSVSDKTANITFAGSTAYKGAKLIGALYDGDTLAEVKTKTVTVEENSDTAESLTFENNPADYDLKVFLWSDVEGMEPIFESDILKKDTPN